MTTASSATRSSEPLRFNAPPQCAKLRELLRRVAYTHQGLCERLEIASVYDFKEVRDGRPKLPDAPDGLLLFVRLFLDAEDVPWSDVRSALSNDEITLLQE